MLWKYLEKKHTLKHILYMDYIYMLGKMNTPCKKKKNHAGIFKIKIVSLS